MARKPKKMSWLQRRKEHKRIVAENVRRRAKERAEGKGPSDTQDYFPTSHGYV